MLLLCLYALIDSIISDLFAYAASQCSQDPSRPILHIVSRIHKCNKAHKGLPRFSRITGCASPRLAAQGDASP
jgi:hypothetical protein